MDPRALTVELNEHINNRDLDGLAKLMTDDHTFIDTADHVIRGQSDFSKPGGFFKLFPDYRNAFDRLFVEDNRVIVVGRSSCSDRRLDGPALWVVKGERQQTR